MPREYTVTDSSKREVIRVVERVFKSVYGDNILTQELKNYTRVRDKGTRDEVKIKEVEEGVKLNVTLTGEDARSKIIDMLDISSMYGHETYPDDIEEKKFRTSSIEENQKNKTSREQKRTSRDGGGQMGRVYKPFSHEDADYKHPRDEDFNQQKPRCKDCAHFDNHGNCRLVNDIEEEGYCENFYSDVAISGRNMRGTIENSLVMWGERFNFTKSDVKKFVGIIKEKLNKRGRK